MPVIWVTTDLIGLILIGVALLLFGFFGGIYVFYRYAKRYYWKDY